MGNDAISAVTELVNAFAAQHRAPSVSWGVVRDGALAASGASGELDDGRAPTSATVYRIASMTKSFTAAVVLALRDEGVLRLDDPIATHAPELAAVKGPTIDTAPITLGDVLSMSSGMATDDVWADRHLDITDRELDDIVASGAYFACSPGTRFEYSNLGFALIGRIVRRASGRTVQEHVTERFLQRLGMTRTTWVQPGHDDWARPYRWNDDRHAVETLVGDGSLAPMGGIWTCVDDLATWVSWLDDAFPARDAADDGLLRRASRREMQQSHRYAGQREIAGRRAPHGYGYGLLMRDDPVLGMLAGHSGGLPGYGSNMRWAPGRRVGAIALVNVTYAPAAELTVRILDALHEAGEVPAAQPPNAPEVHRLAAELVALLNDWDDARAAQLFTDNVAMDDTFDVRRARIASLTGDDRPLTIRTVTPLTCAAADVSLVDAAGSTLTLGFEVGPLVPARIESFTLERPATT